MNEREPGQPPYTRRFDPGEALAGNTVPEFVEVSPLEERFRAALLLRSDSGDDPLGPVWSEGEFANNEALQYAMKPFLAQLPEVIGAERLVAKVTSFELSRILADFYDLMAEQIEHAPGQTKLHIAPRYLKAWHDSALFVDEALESAPEEGVDPFAGAPDDLLHRGTSGSGSCLRDDPDSLGATNSDRADQVLRDTESGMVWLLREQAHWLRVVTEERGDFDLLWEEIIQARPALANMYSWVRQLSFAGLAERHPGFFVPAWLEARR